MSDFTNSIDQDAPLRLRKAAELAFPGGGMAASGLRREAIRGRLVVERIAGKDYTTLAAITKMRELCRVQAKADARVRPRNLSPERPVSEQTVNFLAQSDVRLNGPLSLRERLRSDCAQADKVNKARPISKRERDALKLISMRAERRSR